MIIRREHLAKFAEHASKDFVSRIVTFLREEHQELSQTDEPEFTQTVEVLVERAKAYKMDTERGAAVYVYTAYLLGVDFDTEFPAAHVMLTSPVASSGDKAQWLTEWTAELFASLEGGKA